jgi:hypothetical protein
MPAAFRNLAIIQLAAFGTRFVIGFPAHKSFKPIGTELEKHQWLSVKLDKLVSFSFVKKWNTF